MAVLVMAVGTEFLWRVDWRVLQVFFREIGGLVGRLGGRAIFLRRKSFVGRGFVVFVGGEGLGELKESVEEGTKLFEEKIFFFPGDLEGETQQHWWERLE